jgi:tetratricopeptide (TPR) repeat protein
VSHGGPSQIGSYRVLGELGRGGLGVVYRAQHPHTLGHVAIKVLLQPTPEQRQRFQIEATAAAQLKHSHVVAVHDLGWEGNLPYMVLDLVEGESLADRLKRGPLPLDEALRCAEGMASALAAAHAQGTLHRDVKPSNVMLDEGGEPRLTDFGLARLEDASGLTRTGALLGTPAYAAPEQIDDASRAGPPADVYGLGATLYEMLSGELPYGRGRTVLNQIKAALQDDPVPLTKVAPAVDLEVAELCMRCLARDPADRPVAVELVRELAALRREATASRAAIRKRQARSGQPLVAAAAIVAVGVVAAGVLVASRSQPRPAPIAEAEAEAEAEPEPVPEAEPEPEPVPEAEPTVGAGFTPALPGEPEQEPGLSPRHQAAREMATLYARRDLDGYVARARELLADDPFDPLWQCVGVYGSWEKGLPYAEALLARGVETGLGHKLVAAFLIKCEEDDVEVRLARYQQALELLERAWRLEPVLLEDDDFFHHYGEAVRLALSDDPAQRIERFRWSIEANRSQSSLNRLWHFKNLAVALREQGHGDEALETMLAAAKEYPSYSATWLHLGDQLRLSGHLEDAKVSYQRVVDLIEPALRSPTLPAQARGELTHQLEAAQAQLAQLAGD